MVLTSRVRIAHADTRPRIANPGVGVDGPDGGRLAEQRVQLSRMQTAEAGPKRKEILKEIYSAQSIENLELIDMTTALGGLRPPSVFLSPSPAPSSRNRRNSRRESG